MNQFDMARRFYSMHTPLILQTPRNEWAGDHYAWEPYIRMTPIEAWLWGDIRDAGIILYPQYPVDRYFADFANPLAKVVVECDGAAFHKDKDRDDLRDTRMHELGWHVYRLTGRACRTEFDEETREYGVARRLMDQIGDRHEIRRNNSRSSWDIAEPIGKLLDHLEKANQA
jgi:very-short-patch-repair endonuclease